MRVALGRFQRAEEERSGEAEAAEAGELVQEHGEGCPRSGTLSQGSCSLSGCKRETWTHQESQPGKSTQLYSTGNDNGEITKVRMKPASCAESTIFHVSHSFLFTLSIGVPPCVQFAY